MGCLAFTIAGVFEIGGFGLVVYEIRGFPEQGGWVRRGLPGYGDSLAALGRSQSTACHATAHAGGSVALTVERGPATTLEGQVARVEQQIED